MPHYDTFRLQLGIAHPDFGHALWDTSSGEQYPPVEVGDVGFIRQGKFHRLFNALYSENHPCNQRFGVPEDHERLPPVPNHIDSGTLHPNNFCSYGVTATSGGGSDLHAAGPPIPGSAEVSFSCTRKLGAALYLPVPAQREDTLAQEHFRQWITGHIDSWFAFSRQRGLGIEMEDIVLVTGYHRTRSSSNIVFYENQVNAQVSFGVHVPGSIGTTVIWQLSSQCTRGTMVNHGPSGENLPESQCISIRGFRVERTLRIFSKIRAAAEPKPDPSGNDEPETKVVSIPSVTDYRDPLHVLLEYIAERAPHCDLVVVHDDDLERIMRVGDPSLTSLETLQPAEMMDYLRRLKLEIEVMSVNTLFKTRFGAPNGGNAFKFWAAQEFGLAPPPTFQDSVSEQ
ncbi:hypothetical protein EI94DRAFT_1704292 [Lactarius quietus]|nr:hypothetical protein EI94DRAFT_1704292 [Lactarius quietus]